MNDYLTKPLRRDLFLNRAADHARSSGNLRPDSSTGPSVTSRAQLRYNDFLQEVDGEAFLAAELIDGFSIDSRRRLDAARGALDRLDLEKLHREAHSIKGGALNLMADQLAECALNLEKAAQNALTTDLPDSGVLAELLENLDEAHQRFVHTWESIREKNEADERQPGPL
jgi:HPt (histidine-containing phosphotransfer) domain-containing protein